MNLLPIIVRELRAEARHPMNYRLRMLGAGLLTASLTYFLWADANVRSGSLAFSNLSAAVFCAIWIAVPLLTADCLSREKREGTLGLLFLTPLQPIEIVLGKGTAHVVRALTLLLAATPVLTVPFLLGGITTSDVLRSFLLDLTALTLSLAAGLLASSFCRQWMRAIILAEVFAAGFALLLLKIATASFLGPTGGTGSLSEKFSAISQIFFNDSNLQSLAPLAAASTHQVLAMASSLLAVAVLASALVIVFAASRLKKTWQENPPASGRRRIEQIFFTPRFWLALLRRRNQARLSRNPIGWLQQYSWSARLSKWGWCLIVVAILSWILGADYQLLDSSFPWLKTAMLLSMAFSAVGSFQREKQNGALELLLVAPLGEKQIILGRLRGIWGQFLPGFSILLLTIYFFPRDNYGRETVEMKMLASLRDFIVVPVVGLYFAIHLKNFMAAWLWTAGLALFLPLFLTGFAQTLLVAYIAHLTAILLYFELKNRSFVFGAILKS